MAPGHSGSERRERCDDCAIPQANTLSSDVRILTERLTILAGQWEKHLTFNDEFMPKINALMTQVALIDQRLKSLEESNKVLRGGMVSIIVALIIAGIIAAIKSGGAA